MKKIALLFSLFLISVYSKGTNYYLANSGNDSNSGTSAAAPWQTITKLNTVTFASGDSIFFNCGDTFRGNVIVGNAVSNIAFTSYGSGNKPIISGAELVTGWSTADSVYTASITGSVTNFFVSDKEQTLARYPNEHSYLTLDSGQTTYLKDAALSGLNSNFINGSKVCVHSSQWSWEKAKITSYASNKINYGNTMLKPLNNYGYFLYDNINLISSNEWQYDTTNHIMHYCPAAGTDPNTLTCEASVYQNGIEFAANVSHVSITNLAFEKQTNTGIQIGYNTDSYIAISNCYFSGQYNYGINIKGKHCQVSNSYLRDIDGMAIYINGSGSGSSTVDHNTFRSIGITRASGLGGQLNGTALMCAADSNYFHHNDIDSAGYCGISADGGHNLVERNIINNAVMIENDGGAIKGWGSTTSHSTYQNNFVTNSDGNTEGTSQASFITPAIYFDFNVNSCTIANNTVYHHNKKGIFQNSANINNTITGNVIYGGSYLLDLNGSSLAPNAVPISGMTITHNTFFSKDSNSYIVRQLDYSGANNIGVMDSNYYFQPYSANHYAFLVGTSTPPTSFADWQTARGFDTHTQSSFVSWTYPIAYDTLFMNQTDNDLTINLGSDLYLDLDSIDVCGSITLAPYTSQVLINTNTTTACTTDIKKITNSSKQIKVYPNPTSNEFKISSDSDLVGMTYKVLDITGKLMLTGSMTSNEESISAENLTVGVYLISLEGNNQSFHTKLIKQ